jgi:hypothetical protein
MKLGKWQNKDFTTACGAWRRQGRPGWRKAPGGGSRRLGPAEGLSGAGPSVAVLGPGRPAASRRLGAGRKASLWRVAVSGLAGAEEADV